MKRFIILLSICVCVLAAKTDSYEGTLTDGKNFPSLFSDGTASSLANHLVDSFYTKVPLEEYGLCKEVFYKAYKGYQYLLSQAMLNNTGILTICDYSQSSHKKRLYVIDVNEGKLLFNTYVSHGRNSGSEFATSFSNKMNSNKSSLGFLITSDTYFGRNGYSLRFNGVEAGINDQVRNRAIVMHGSNYVNAQRADEGTMMGRSFGCPAVAASENKKIIDAIKDGSCFFVYSANNWYTRNSRIINASFQWPVQCLCPM